MRWFPLLMFLMAIPALAQVRLAAIFSDGMVLQRQMAVPVWGTAAPGESVTVRFAGQEKKATADDTGRWTVRLDALEASSQPAELTAIGTTTVTVHDVLVGEVWLCAGQSNMEFVLSGCAGAAETIAAASYPSLRMFTVAQTVAPSPRADVRGLWQSCTPATAPGFSAIAFYLGRALQQRYQMPVGLVVTAYGATSSSAWTPRDVLRRFPELEAWVDKWDAQAKAYAEARQAYEIALTRWHADVAAAQLAGTPAPPRPREPANPIDRRFPAGCYNGMLAPLIPLAVRGVAWYQGESNGVTPACYTYQRDLEAMIQEWRRLWGRDDLPFVYMQLAPIGAQATDANNQDAWAFVRDAQRRVLRLPHTGMAVTIDSDADMHPKRKAEAGERLALAARAVAYGDQVEYSGPCYDTLTVAGDTVRVRFTHAAGLKAIGDQVVGFALAGEDRQFVWATATIEGETVVLRAPGVANPVAVRYAWGSHPVFSLVNAAGLPASPFRTDDWSPGGK